MNKTTIRFAPWIGSNYAEGFHGLRMLLVCESHYGAKHHERPTVTPEIVKALALGEKHPKAAGKLRRHPHFAKIMAAVNGAKQDFAYPSRRDFWSRVAYYNYLQLFIARSRINPPPCAWEQGKEAFAEVLAVLSPDVIICFSRRSGKYLRALAGTVPVAVVNHPSSRFAYNRVKPIIGSHIESALACKTQSPDFTPCAVFDRWRVATTSALPSPGSHLSTSDLDSLVAERTLAMAAHDLGIPIPA